MKKTLALVLVIMMGLSIAACGSTNSDTTGSNNNSTVQGQQSSAQGENEPITLQTQGSFAVGGTVITAPGTFDPIKQGAYNPAGLILLDRPCTETTLMSFIKFQSMPESCP